MIKSTSVRNVSLKSTALKDALSIMSCAVNSGLIFKLRATEATHYHLTALQMGMIALAGTPAAAHRLRHPDVPTHQSSDWPAFHETGYASNPHTDWAYRRWVQASVRI